MTCSTCKDNREVSWQLTPTGVNAEPCPDCCPECEGSGDQTNILGKDLCDVCKGGDEVKSPIDLDGMDPAAFLKSMQCKHDWKVDLKAIAEGKDLWRGWKVCPKCKSHAVDSPVEETK